MNKKRQIALLAAKYMVDRVETEYLHAKEKAIQELRADRGHMPSNRQIKHLIKALTENQLGKEEINKRLTIMRSLAEEIMSFIEEYDPHLIGSVLHGTIRDGSDIDIHAYGDAEEIQDRLETVGYEVSLETVENIKGSFSHLRIDPESQFHCAIEITIYTWSERHQIMISSISQKPMKRWNLTKLRRKLTTEGV